MQVSFSASGTPAQINAAIQQQSKAARAAHGPHAAPAISSVRDYIGAELAAVGVEEKVSVSASIAVTISKAKPEAKVAVAAATPAAEPEKK